MNVSILLVLHCDIMKHCKFLFTKINKPSMLCALLVAETKIPKVSTSLPLLLLCVAVCIPVSSIGSADGRQTVQAITLHLSATAGREMLNCIT